MSMKRDGDSFENFEVDKIPDLRKRLGCGQEGAAYSGSYTGFQGWRGEDMNFIYFEIHNNKSWGCFLLVFALLCGMALHCRLKHLVFALWHEWERKRKQRQERSIIQGWFSESRKMSPRPFTPVTAEVFIITSPGHLNSFKRSSSGRYGNHSLQFHIILPNVHSIEDPSKSIRNKVLVDA